MNKIFNIVFVVASLLIGGVGSVAAQSSSHVYNYSCDFEDPEEVKQWNLMVGGGCGSLYCQQMGSGYGYQ